MNWNVFKQARNIYFMIIEMCKTLKIWFKTHRSILQKNNKKRFRAELGFLYDENVTSAGPLPCEKESNFESTFTCSLTTIWISNNIFCYFVTKVTNTGTMQGSPYVWYTLYICQIFVTVFKDISLLKMVVSRISYKVYKCYI